MYCDKCHKEYQPIYDKIAKKFSSFIRNNQDLLDALPKGEVIRIDLTGRRIILDKFSLCQTDMLSGPYNVRYLCKRDYGEGDMIEFLDESLNKVFSYYDVM